MREPVTRVREGLFELSALAAKVAWEQADAIVRVAGMVAETLGAGGRLFFCGNGGSAADAQHLAAEYVVRFRRDRRALPALALTTDTSVLTAASNDFGFETVFARQIEALGRPGDLLFLHSTSGESENLLRAAAAARAAGVRTIALLARGGGRLRALVDLALVLPTEAGARAQELHLAIGHVVCGLVEESLGSGAGPTEAGPAGGGR
ncbi:MAG: SIS domain-containing protein [Gemmatimonadetes bacterium]|nr:SIS domain-containing protein [Gemmatimonadota bacterium]